MKYVIANWKGKIPNPPTIEEWARNLVSTDDVKIIICKGHNGELGVELRWIV